MPCVGRALKLVAVVFTKFNLAVATSALPRPACLGDGESLPGTSPAASLTAGRRPGGSRDSALFADEVSESEDVEDCLLLQTFVKRAEGVVPHHVNAPARPGGQEGSSAAAAAAATAAVPAVALAVAPSAQPSASRGAAGEPPDALHAALGTEALRLAKEPLEGLAMELLLISRYSGYSAIVPLCTLVACGGLVAWSLYFACSLSGSECESVLVEVDKGDSAGSALGELDAAALPGQGRHARGPGADGCPGDGRCTCAGELSSAPSTVPETRALRCTQDLSLRLPLGALRAARGASAADLVGVGGQQWGSVTLATDANQARSLTLWRLVAQNLEPMARASWHPTLFGEGIVELTGLSDFDRVTLETVNGSHQDVKVIYGAERNLVLALSRADGGWPILVAEAGTKDAVAVALCHSEATGAKVEVRITAGADVALILTSVISMAALFPV